MKKSVILFIALINTFRIMSQDFSKLESYLDKKITGKTSPGVQFLIADSSGILFEYNKGTADFDTQTPVNANTQFKMYSSTKLITMFAVMQLVEQGKISLDSPVSDYIEIDYSKEITIRKILSHTAGFGRNAFIKEIHLVREDEGFDYSDFMKRALAQYNKTISVPGQKNVYSNYGFLVLSAVVEKVSGMSYEDYIKGHLISKVDLSSDDYMGFKYTDLTSKGQQKRKTLIHWIYSLIIDKKTYYGTKTKQWQSLNDLYMRGLGFGGGISNSRALAAVMLSLMQNKILDENTLKETFEIQTYKSNKQAKHCLAWWHGEVNGHKSYFHPGGGGGYSCEVRIYPEKGLVRIMMMNKTQTPKDLKIYKKIDKLWLVIEE